MQTDSVEDSFEPDVVTLGKLNVITTAYYGFEQEIDRIYMRPDVFFAPMDNFSYLVN